jgi:hypothetical protein
MKTMSGPTEGPVSRGRTRVCGPRRLALPLLAVLALGVSGCGDPPVGPTPPRTLELSFSRDTLILDRWADTATVGVTVRDETGGTVRGVSVTFESLDPGVAQVSAAGLVRSLALGTARIRVTASGGSGVASVQREVTARVVIQPNSACLRPEPRPRGPASGTITFANAEYLEHLPTPTLDGYRTIPLDFDGDGDVDIVRLEYSYPSSSPYTGAVRVFRNQGDGTFENVSTSAVLGIIVPDHPRDFEVADFTGDGVPDLYVAQHGFDASPFPGAPNLLLTRAGNQLTNQFQSRFSPARSSGFSHGSSVADVDCDGDLDLVEINVSNLAPNALFLNNGAGNFSEAPQSAFPVATQIRWQEAAFIDIDADGDPDLFLGARATPGSNQDLILINDGFGRFRERDGVRPAAGLFSPLRAINNAKAADFNGDGLDDLLLFEIPQPFSTVSAIRLWLNNGNGSFSDESAAWGLPPLCDGEVIEPLWVQDLNGDGWPDVLLPWGCGQLGTGIFVNTGSRFNFVSFTQIEPWFGGDNATPIDLDGSGRPALLFGDRGGSPALVRIR